MEFIAKNKVRMHDTDMAGLLYFARQFRFAHEALEDFLENCGMHLDHLFRKSKYAFVIVHCEADYFASMTVGDKLEIHVSVEKIGRTSFTMLYKIFRETTLVGTVKTVHVCLNNTTRQKVEVPEELRHTLKKYHAVRAD